MMPILEPLNSFACRDALASSASSCTVSDYESLHEILGSSPAVLQAPPAPAPSGRRSESCMRLASEDSRQMPWINASGSGASVRRPRPRSARKRGTSSTNGRIERLLCHGGQYAPQGRSAPQNRDDDLVPKSGCKYLFREASQFRSRERPRRHARNDRIVQLRARGLTLKEIAAGGRPKRAAMARVLAERRDQPLEDEQTDGGDGAL